MYMQLHNPSEQHAQYLMLHRETQRGHTTLLQHLLTLRQQTPTSFTVRHLTGFPTLDVCRAVQTGVQTSL